MKYYIIAGEASGDLHGSNLMKALQREDPEAEFRFWGGDKMQAVGGTLVKHIRDLAFMGFVEVLQHLGTIMSNISFCKKDILHYQPDAIVFIDYPGFNMRICEWAKKLNFKTIYYISPQIWAWKEGRVKKIRKYVDQMITILPFEKAFYKKHNFDVDYVGHPLTEVIQAALKVPIEPLSDKPIIALLPGSRKQEIAIKLPIMLAIIPHFPDYEFVIAQAPNLEKSFYETFYDASKSTVSLAHNQTYNLLKQAAAALVTSGTATLETALIGCPEIVCYKGNAISYQLAKRLIKVKYISLVNLILDKEAVKELIQGDLNTTQLVSTLQDLLHNPTTQTALKKDYTKLWELLGEATASTNAAKLIVATMKKV